MDSTLTVSSTELARHFSEYIAQVRYGNKTIIVEKSHCPVAELRPLSSGKCTLKQLLELMDKSSSDQDFAKDLEIVNDSDIPLENPWD